MKRQKEHRHDIRFDPELDAAILQEDGDFSKVVKRLCRAGLSGNNPNSYSQVIEELNAIRKEIAPIGSNLNQIALAFNSNDHLDGEDLAVVHSDLQRQFAEMTKVLRELRNGIFKHIRDMVRSEEK